MAWPCRQRSATRRRQVQRKIAQQDNAVTDPEQGSRGGEEGDALAMSFLASKGLPEDVFRNACSPNHELPVKIGSGAFSCVFGDIDGQGRGKERSRIYEPGLSGQWCVHQIARILSTARNTAPIGSGVLVQRLWCDVMSVPVSTAICSTPQDTDRCSGNTAPFALHVWKRPVLGSYVWRSRPVGFLFSRLTSGVWLGEQSRR